MLHGLSGSSHIDARIDVQNAEDRQRWAAEFRLSEEQLLHIVQIVGTSVMAIRRFIHDYEQAFFGD